MGVEFRLGDVEGQVDGSVDDALFGGEVDFGLIASVYDALSFVISFELDAADGLVDRLEEGGRHELLFHYCFVYRNLLHLC